MPALRSSAIPWDMREFLCCAASFACILRRRFIGTSRGRGLLGSGGGASPLRAGALLLAVDWSEKSALSRLLE